MTDPTAPTADGLYLTWRVRTHPGGVESEDTALLVSAQQEAMSLGLTKREPGVFTTTVPSAEVTEVRQERSPA